MSDVSLPYPEQGSGIFTTGHAGTDTSQERAEAEAGNGKARERQDAILSTLARPGWQHYGLTVVEVRNLFDLHHGQASSALSVLHKDGRVARLAERRDRCKVYVLPEHILGRDTEAHGRRKGEVYPLPPAAAFVDPGDVYESSTTPAKQRVRASMDTLSSWDVIGLLSDAEADAVHEMLAEVVTRALGRSLPI